MKQCFNFNSILVWLIKTLRYVILRFFGKIFYSSLITYNTLIYWKQNWLHLMDFNSIPPKARRTSLFWLFTTRSDPDILSSWTLVSILFWLFTTSNARIEKANKNKELQFYYSLINYYTLKLDLWKIGRHYFLQFYSVKKPPGRSSLINYNTGLTYDAKTVYDILQFYSSLNIYNTNPTLYYVGSRLQFYSVKKTAGQV